MPATIGSISLAKNRPRVGFVVDGCIPSSRALIQRKCPSMALIRGWDSGSSVSLMRFGWIAECINAGNRLKMELYRPWRQYDLIVFMKSMGPASYKLARDLKRRGIKTIFDVNVDYLTPPEGVFYYQGMAPTKEQRRDALAMASVVDLCVADSEHIQSVVRHYHDRCEWIADNVHPRLIKPTTGEAFQGGKLNLFWSGMPEKLFDLLLLEEILRSHADKVRLKIITGPLSRLEMCYEPYRNRIRRLLSDLDVEVIPFKSIDALCRVYKQGGVFISPRFLDNSYNLGHTEWKITLPLGCGLPVLCSPQRSYCTVVDRGAQECVTLCNTLADWDRALTNQMVSDHLTRTSRAGPAVVQRWYATPVIAHQYTETIIRLLS